MLVQGADFFADESAVHSLSALLVTHLFPSDKPSAPPSKCRRTDQQQTIALLIDGTVLPCIWDFHVRNVRFISNLLCLCMAISV